jgi:hypothetical protein
VGVSLMSLAASKVIGANTSVLAEIMRTLSRQRSLMQPLHMQIEVKCIYIVQPAYMCKLGPRDGLVRQPAVCFMSQ